MAEATTGYIGIEYMDGKSATFPFSENKGWNIDDTCLIIRFEDHHDRHPLVNIRTTTIWYNTPEYVDQVRERGEDRP
jgi:hypothetical protein